MSCSTWVLCFRAERGGFGRNATSTCSRVQYLASKLLNLNLNLNSIFPGSLTFLLAMGRDDGVGQVNGYYVGRLLVTIAKSRDLFVSKSWKTMGQTMPS